jgi:hypothetical protein
MDGEGEDAWSFKKMLTKINACSPIQARRPFYFLRRLSFFADIKTPRRESDLLTYLFEPGVELGTTLILRELMRLRLLR